LQIGRVFKRNNLPDSALYHYQHALSIYKKIKNTERTATAYTNMSGACELQREYEDGLNYAQRAMDLWAKDSLKYYKGIVSAYNNMANCYDHLHQPDDAILYNKKALVFIHRLNSEQQQQVHWGDTEYGLSNRYVLKEDFESAEPHMEQALALFIQQKDKFGEGMAYEHLGLIAMNMRKQEVAEHFYARAEETYKAIEDSIGLSNIYFNLGELHFSQKNYSASKTMYGQALSFFQGSDKVFPRSIRDGIEVVKDRIKHEKLYFSLSILGLIAIMLCIFALWKWFAFQKQEMLARQERKAIIVQKELLETKRLNILQQERLMSKEKEVVASQKKLLKLKENFDQIRHNIIKTNISTIENYITTSITSPTVKVPDKNLSTALAVIKRLQHVAEKPFYGQRKQMTLGHLVEEMHIIAEETCCMNVQLYAEIDDAHNYPVKVFVQSNIESIIYIAFNNIRQHANCQYASLSFAVDENGMLITIEDNGVGFNPEAIRAGAEGLSNIKVAVQKLNGSHNIHSVIGEGSKIEVSIPSFLDEKNSFNL